MKFCSLIHRLRRQTQVLLVCVLVLTVNNQSFAEGNQKQKALTFGFFPIISTIALYKRFGPLADYIQSELGHPVHLVTAKDFSTFKNRTDKGAYDFVITAPHFAVKASDSGLYKIKATLLADVQQLVVVHKDSSLQSMEQLAGKVIATPPEKALMTKMGKDFFTKELNGGKAPSYIAYASHNAANEAVIAGEADAAIASSNTIKKSLKGGAALKVIARGLTFPNMATMIASDMDELLAQRITDIFINMKNTDAGKLTLKKIAFPGYKSISPEAYDVVRPYQ